MPYYQIDYFYLATGMDGIPDTKDYGVWFGSTPEIAKGLAINHHDGRGLSPTTVQWIMSCLTAREITNPRELE